MKQHLSIEKSFSIYRKVATEPARGRLRRRRPDELDSYLKDWVKAAQDGTKEGRPALQWDTNDNIRNHNSASQQCKYLCMTHHVLCESRDKIFLNKYLLPAAYHGLTLEIIPRKFTSQIKVSMTMRSYKTWSIHAHSSIHWRS